MANPNPKPGLANLRPWKPGQSGNPSGRPKKQPYLEAMMIRANMRAPEAVIVKLNSTVPCVPCKGTGVQGTPERPIRCRHCKGSKFEALIWPDATYAEVEACILHNKAVSGDIAALRELADRIEGTPPQRLVLDTGPQRVETIFHMRYEDPGKRKE